MYIGEDGIYVAIRGIYQACTENRGSRCWRDRHRDRHDGHAKARLSGLGAIFEPCHRHPEWSPGSTASLTPRRFPTRNLSRKPPKFTTPRGRRAPSTLGGGF